MKKNSVHSLMREKKYFDVGFHWYFDRYLSFFWQKRLFYFLFFIAILTLGTLIEMNMGILLDSKIVYPVLTHIDNYDEVAFIKKLQSKKTDDPNVLIANYLVEKYVTIRESYNYENLNEQKLFIDKNSTSFLSLSFNNYIDISNIKSPLLLYGKKDKLNVSIKNIDLKIDDSNIPKEAIVNFDIYKNYDLLSTQSIEMEFYMSDALSLRKDDGGNFEFSVFKYNIL